MTRLKQRKGLCPTVEDKKRVLDGQYKHLTKYDEINDFCISENLDTRNLALNLVAVRQHIEPSGISSSKGTYPKSRRGLYR